MDSLTRDLRYAVRSLAKSKGFAAVAVGSLALALGLNTTTYAVLDSYMHPYVPYRAPERLVGFSVRGDPRERAITNVQRNLELRERVTFAQDIAVWSFARALVDVGAVAEDLFMVDVSPNFFSVLDVPTETGRTFQATGDDNTVVVSHALWLRLLGKQPLETLAITINGQSYSIIGVMPPAMEYPYRIDMWRRMPPADVDVALRRTSLNLVARLKDEVSEEAALAEVERYATELEARYAGTGVSFRAILGTLAPDPFDLSNFHLALAGCALVVLLIACANLANLMLARGVARRGELALRLAIGASRKAVIQQLTTEAVLLALAGGAIGVLAAVWGVSAAVRGLPQMTFLTLFPPHVSWRVLVFGVLMTALTVVLFGFLPALKASDLNVAEPLKESAGTTTGRRHRRHSLLAVSQMALALVLLMAGAVLARSAWFYANQDFGYDTDGLYAATIDLIPQRLADATAVPRFQNVRERLLDVPGVDRVATYAHVATVGRVAMSDYERADSLPVVVLWTYLEVSSDYLRTLGIPVVAGRDFEPGDQRVAIVNRPAALALWRDQSPVGRMIKLGPPHSTVPWIRVIGVAASSKELENDPHLPGTPRVYVAAGADTVRRRIVLFRSDGSNPKVALDVARELQAAAALPVPPRVFPERYSFTERSNAQRFTSRIFVFLGLCGLGLASVGLYGVLAYTVSRRMREFGVRIALGAGKQDVFRLVIHDGAIMFVGGTAIGAFAAMAAGKFLDDLLYGVPYTDPVSLAICEVILCVAGLLACLAPARRAARSDPMEILRAS